MLLAEVQKALEKTGLLVGAPLRFSDCPLVNPSLLTRRLGETVPESVLMLAAPYDTGDKEGSIRNLSRYAVPRDYHLFWKEFFAEFLPALERLFPGERFFGFADHSPIDERLSAARAGLGCLGDNGLLITPRHGSYVFLGEILSTLPPERWTEDGILPPVPDPLPRCPGCGTCRAACPMNADGLADCLSFLTQQKGELAPATVAAMRKYATCWGCDICQTACPLNAGAAPTPIAFFREARLPHLTPEALSAMSEDEFSSRAYAWKGRTTISRNLTAISLEKDNTK